MIFFSRCRSLLQKEHVTKSDGIVTTQRRFILRFGRIITLEEIFISMQNGAPPDWSWTVRQWLNQKLPSRWIVKGSDDTKRKWPCRSLDLTSCDFIQWWSIRSKNYYTQPRDITENRIRQVIWEVTMETLHNKMFSF